MIKGEGREGQVWGEGVHTFGQPLLANLLYCDTCILSKNLVLLQKEKNKKNNKKKE